VAAEERDAQAIFAVRALLVLVVAFVITALGIAGVAKLVSPSYDAGHVALVGGWLGGIVLTMLLLRLWRDRRRR
jgi:hypothetical protein